MARELLSKQTYFHKSALLRGRMDYFPLIFMRRKIREHLKKKIKRSREQRTMKREQEKKEREQGWKNAEGESVKGIFVLLPKITNFMLPAPFIILGYTPCSLASQKAFSLLPDYWVCRGLLYNIQGSALIWFKDWSTIMISIDWHWFDQHWLELVISIDWHSWSALFGMDDQHW